MTEQSTEEAAVVQRFEAAADAEESLRVRVASAMHVARCEARCDLGPTDGQLVMADAAIAVMRGAAWHVHAHRATANRAADAVLALPALRDLIAERDTLAAQVQAVEGLAEEWAALCPADDWPSGGMENAVIADCGRYLRRALGTPTTGGGE